MRGLMEGHGLKEAGRARRIDFLEIARAQPLHE